MGGVCVLLGGRSKKITYWATGLVKELCIKIVADLTSSPCSVGRGVNVEGSGNTQHPLPSSLTSPLH